MSRSGSKNAEGRLRGVTERPAAIGEPRFRARIGQGKGRQVNLGLYPTRWLAAFAYNVAASALYGDRRAKNEIPDSEQPSTEHVRRITSRVRQRLELDALPEPPEDRPPDADQLLTLLEIAVVGFWRGQVHRRDADLVREIDLSARRLVEATHALFWSHSSGHPTPLEALTTVLARRLDRAFGRADLTREVLDDEGDDEERCARWLVYPDDGFEQAVGTLYADLLGAVSNEAIALPAWALVLEIAPPFSADQVRNAYRARSKAVHPDAGGSNAEFVRLQGAYEDALRACSARRW